MRGVLIALATIAFVQGAAAADYGGGFLRGSSAYELGSPQYFRWGGVYFGGQAAYSQASVDFTDATKSLIAFSLRNLALEAGAQPSEWEVLGKSDHRAPSFGGFVGYNSQWDNVVLGLELNYNSGTFATIDAPLTPIRRVVTVSGNTYDATITGAAAMKITDFGSVRARAAYVMGTFMPYAFVGLSVGRSNISRTATAFGTETTSNNVVTPFSFTDSEDRNGAFMFGWATGGGIDVALGSRLFLRTEAEFLGFAPVSGIKASILSGRAAVGVKF